MQLLDRIYERKFILGEDVLEAARGFMGNLARLRIALQKLLDGMNISAPLPPFTIYGYLNLTREGLSKMQSEVAATGMSTELNGFELLTRLQYVLMCAFSNLWAGVALVEAAVRYAAAC